MMTSHTRIFPAFDTFELTEAPELPLVRFELLYPAKAGAIIPGLRSGQHRGNWHNFFDDIVVNDNAYILSYAYKPLLLYFYEHDWGAASREHLRQLNAIQNDLNGRQTNILVITARSLQQFRDITKTDRLSLEVYKDGNNELASLLQLYGDNSPSWSRYAGVERNVALPGLYLLDHSRRVVFAHPNQDIEPELPVQQILGAFPGNNYRSERKSA